jgi:tRNA-dihydrouridine synthase B
MPFRVGNVVIPRAVLLAPMAGITDLPFRRLVARFGVGLTTSEMVASRELLAANRTARARAELGAAGQGPAAVQLAGREPELLAEAARAAAGLGADIVDINMGCPAKKVTGGWCGAALMREPDHALRLVEAVVAAVDVPVTVKMRLGWDDAERSASALAARLEAAGAAMIAVHGRTRAQFYEGAADWGAIRAVVEAVRVPVAANGDVVDVGSARAALAASGAAAVMVGRGAQGAPWVPDLIARGLEGEAAAEPDLAARGALLLEHREALLSFYGRDLGARVARKHVGWALARMPGGRALRDAVVRIADPDEAGRVLARGLAAIAGGEAGGEAAGAAAPEGEGAMAQAAA